MNKEKIWLLLLLFFHSSTATQRAPSPSIHPSIVSIYRCCLLHCLRSFFNKPRWINFNLKDTRAKFNLHFSRGSKQKRKENSVVGEGITLTSNTMLREREENKLLDVWPKMNVFWCFEEAAVVVWSSGGVEIHERPHSVWLLLRGGRKRKRDGRHSTTTRRHDSCSQ